MVCGRLVGGLVVGGFNKTRTDNCLKSKSTKLQILQTLSSWESFCDTYLREIQEKDYLKTLTVIVQLAKNYAIACSKFLETWDDWDGNSVVQPPTLLKSITNSTFIAAFHTIKYFFGFTHKLSLALQGVWHP